MISNCADDIAYLHSKEHGKTNDVRSLSCI